MKPSESRSTSVDNQAIDRLVDGGLNEVERRDLLLALENDPEGWRRCSLAFLEDQAWRSALSGRFQVVVKNEPTLAAPNAAQPTVIWLRRVSIAASILGAAFAVGFAVGGISRVSPTVEMGRPDPSKSVKAAILAQNETVHEVGWIDIVDDSNGESPSRRVPILSGPGIDEKLLQEQPPSVPEYVRARLERQGYQVAEKRKLVSVTLEDGRRVSIPVDEVALDYVGQNPL